jgi:Dienelactone hydrolase family
MGGTVAFIAATRLGGLAASICYYGGQIVRFADNKPRCPVQMHFGEKDASITMGDVETIRQKRPECEIFTYPGAGHAFNRDESASYEPNSARIAWQRTLAFLTKALGNARPKPPAAAVAKSMPPKPASSIKPKPKSVSKPKKRSKPKRKPKGKKRVKAKARKKSKSRR